MQAGPGRQHSTTPRGTGSSRTKKYTFFAPNWRFGQQRVGATPTGRGTGALSREDGTGWGWAGLAAGAPSLPHSNWERWGSSALQPGQEAVPVPRSHHTPRCQPQPQGKERAGGTGQAPEGAGSRLLRAGWHERPGMEQQAFPSARQEHHGHTHGTGQAGHPQQPAHTCGKEERECPALGSCQDMEWPLLHQGPLRGSQRCEGPVERGEPCHGTELSHHPPSLSPSVEDTQGTDTTQPSPGTILGRSKAPKASLGRLRTAEQGQGWTRGCNDTTQNRG